MKKESCKLNHDQRLKEVAHLLARGVVKMKEDGELLTSRCNETETVLQKPLKHVNQRVSG